MEEEIKKEETQEKTLEEKIKEGRELDRMTAPELKEIAMKIEGVTGAHAMKKEELLKIIKAARGIPEEEVVKKAKKEPAAAVSVAALKQKVRQLKAEKVAARGADDRKKVNVLRRRINRMKKRTKRVAQA